MPIVWARRCGDDFLASVLIQYLQTSVEVSVKFSIVVAIDNEII